MLNPVEEEKYRKLREQCKELRVVTAPDVFIGLQVHRDGKLVFDDIQRGHSWTRNYYNLMFAWGADAAGDGVSTTIGASKMSVRTTGGTVYKNSLYVCNRMGGTYQTSSGIHGPVSDSSYGIVVGTGSTAFSIDGYALATQITHGTTTGLFSHQASAAATMAYDSTAGAEKWTNTISRIFNNNSGGSVTVAETGLYHNAICYGSSQTILMIERTVLDPTVAVVNGAQLTVTYSIVGDFSAID